MSNELSRRDFVKTAATAVAAPMIVPASVLGRQGAKPPSERITIGVIGVGYQARGHTEFLVRHPDVKVLAVCDVDTTRREGAKKIVDDWYSEDKTYKGCDAYNDFREVIARKDIDAVLIGTPDHWHVIPAVAAMQAGKDVYCEKPLTLTIAEAKVMIDVARKHKTVFQTGSQQRSSKEFRIACEAVRNGRLGKIKQVFVDVGGPSHPCDLPEETLEPGLDWNLWLGQAPDRPYNSVLSPRGIHSHFPNWRAYREYSGGGMTDWGAHHFDIAQWGIGADETGPVEIVPPNGKDVKVLTYHYANGVIATRDPERMSRESPDGNGVLFVGTKGKVAVWRYDLMTWPDGIRKAPTAPNEIRLHAAENHHTDFLNAVRTRGAVSASATIGSRSISVSHLGNIAYELGRPVKWDPKAEQFVNDPEATRLYSRPMRAPWHL